jgi:phosphoglycolate phosphatase-like HAD superfamily hydrolase
VPLRAIVFDFDGVLVESVDVKLDAYAALFAQEGAAVCRKVRDFCATRTGLSRFRLIEAIHQEILGRTVSPAQQEQLWQRFGDLVVDAVVAAPEVQGADRFLSEFAHRYRFFIVSGTPERELGVILRRRGLDRYFDAAFGSPATKEELLGRIMEAGFAPHDLIYVGDSHHDWAAVQTLDIPFIWRRVSPDVPTPPGFGGPVIASLDELPACLPAAIDTITTS